MYQQRALLTNSVQGFVPSHWWPEPALTKVLCPQEDMRHRRMTALACAGALTCAPAKQSIITAGVSQLCQIVYSFSDLFA